MSEVTSQTKANSDPRCGHPAACTARGGALCRACHFRSVAITLHADPEFAAKLHKARLSWCSESYQPLYRELAKKIGAKSARARSVLSQIATDKRMKK